MGFGGLQGSSEFSTVASKPTCANSLSCPDCPKMWWSKSQFHLRDKSPRPRCCFANPNTSKLVGHQSCSKSWCLRFFEGWVHKHVLMSYCLWVSPLFCCVCVVSLSFYICASTKHTPCSCKTWSLQTKALQQVVSLYILLPEEMPNIYTYIYYIHTYVCPFSDWGNWKTLFFCRSHMQFSLKFAAWKKCFEPTSPQHEQNTRAKPI